MKIVVPTGNLQGLVRSSMVLEVAKRQTHGSFTNHPNPSLASAAGAGGGCSTSAVSAGAGLKNLAKADADAGGARFNGGAFFDFLVPAGAIGPHTCVRRQPSNTSSRTDKGDCTC
jgi:hypothetical protein